MPTLQRDGLAGPRTGPTSPASGLVPLVLAAVVAVGLLASVVAARYTGAAAPLPGGLTDAGPVVRWALPLVRVVHDVAASLTIGSLLLAATMIPGRTRAESAALDEPRRAAALRVATAAAFVWALAGAVGVVFTFADAAGMPLSDPLFGRNFTGSVWSIEPLRVGLISAVAAFVVASVAAVARSRAVALALTVVSAFGLLVLGLAGHAGGSADHETAVNAIAAHLLSAAVWVGGLLALIVLRRPLGDALGVVARRYSTVALWCYVTLGASGVMSATTRLGSWSDLATPYGVLVLVKVLAFAVLGVAGVWHRRVTLDRIDETGTSGAGAAGTGVPEGARRLRSRLFVRLAVAETLVMALAFGVATALARSEPPVPETVADPSAALSLTGYPAPPAPTAMSWLTAWRVEWLFLATGLLAVGLYLAGVVRLRRRGDAWPVMRTVSWVVGWLLFVYATNGVLGIYGRVAFSWHMTLHMLEAMVVPIFLVLGAPVTLALRTVRSRRDGTLGPREMLLALIHSRFLAVVGNPVFAAVFFFMSLVVFYWTGLFQLALQTHTGHLLMTAHFVLTGYLFAWVLVGVDPGPKRWSPALRLVVLFATISFHAFFGVAMISGTTLLGGDFFPTVAIPWVTDPLADQRYGGGVAWAIGELPSLVLALTVALQWFRTDSAESVRQDRRADRDGDAELTAYNERLAALARRDEGSRR
ncbi:cytochrome C oxidase assembly protein [Terrabacter sp. Soil811]|uniref:cytochrome c oxidase assembly protein n=1 Tax=Terrabacter sp. Soil811 TaxID=1736419 RepID=UPI0006F868E6|nr:cytochrome c oxidase assembly protein [Terrabacter sp. Soil811]KRF45664.1 cytochrome C oxidase assembly protein [Terrabacter sp. Soil811]